MDAGLVQDERDNSNLLESFLDAFDSKKRILSPNASDHELVDEPSGVNDSKSPAEADGLTGADEFAIYCQNLGRPRSPPPKPKRNKSRNSKASTGSRNSHNSISSELQEIIDSAFGKEASAPEEGRRQPPAVPSKQQGLDLCKRQQPSAPQPTPEQELDEFDFTDNASTFKRSDVARFPESLYHDVNDDTLKRSYGSNPALDSLSYGGSVNSLDCWDPDDDSSNPANEDALSVVSFSMTPCSSPVNDAKEKHNRKDKLRQKISKAVAQKQKVGAIFDVAAGSAGDQLKKMARIKSVRFKKKAKTLQGKPSKIAPLRQGDLNGRATDNEEPKLPTLPEELRSRPVVGKNGHQMATKSGFLKKQGGTIKTWNTRWFVLKGDQLHYYKDMDGKYIATISLSGSRVVTQPVRNNDPSKYVFEIVQGHDGRKIANNHETYLLSANSHADMEEWVKVLRRVILSPFGGGIFGQRLDETLRYDRRLDSSGCGTTSTGKSTKTSDSSPRKAPIIVENCVEFIRKSGGFKEEGLFRLPGHANEVKELQDAYDMGERPMFPSNTDVHTVASLLKGYLRELPEPIIPFERYDALVNVAKDSLSEAPPDSKALGKEEELKAIKEQLNLLPQANYDLLSYMCRFLDEVQRRSDVNKMDISNLAMVFGPNIMRSKRNDPMTMMSDASHVQHVMFQFIANHQQLFPDVDEKQTPMSTIQSLTDVTLNAAGRRPNDPGIGTLNSTASPLGTMALRHTTDDSGTGSLGPTPDNTSKRAPPPIPALPPPLRTKPTKPLRKKLSSQSLENKGNSPSAPNNRKSLYDNVTASSNASSDISPSYLTNKHDWRTSNESGQDGGAGREYRLSSAATSNAPESNYANLNSTPSGPLSVSSPRSSTNAVAGSLGVPDEGSCASVDTSYTPESQRNAPPPSRRRSRKKLRDKGGASGEESNTESVAPDDRNFSTLSSKRSSYQQHEFDLRRDSATLPASRVKVASANRLSMDSTDDGASSASSANAPPVPSRPHRKNKKPSNHSAHDRGQVTSGASGVEPNLTGSASNRSSHVVSSATNSVFGSVLTYKELEEQVKSLQEELRKQRIEHEKRSRMLEEHYIMKMRNSSSVCSPFSPPPSATSNFPRSPTSTSSDVVLPSHIAHRSVTDESVAGSYDHSLPLSPLGSRASIESQMESRFKDETKKHAITKIKLRNAERGLQQAEERNRQLQKEMEEFFQTFGSMMNRADDI